MAARSVPPSSLNSRPSSSVTPMLADSPPSGSQLMNHHQFQLPVASSPLATSASPYASTSTNHSHQQHTNHHANQHQSNQANTYNADTFHNHHHHHQQPQHLYGGQQAHHSPTQLHGHLHHPSSLHNNQSTHVSQHSSIPQQIALQPQLLHHHQQQQHHAPHTTHHRTLQQQQEQHHQAGEMSPLPVVALQSHPHMGSADASVVKLDYAPGGNSATDHHHQHHAHHPHHPTASQSAPQHHHSQHPHSHAHHSSQLLPHAQAQAQTHHHPHQMHHHNSQQQLLSHSQIAHMVPHHPQVAQTAPLYHHQDSSVVALTYSGPHHTHGEHLHHAHPMPQASAHHHLIHHHHHHHGQQHLGSPPISAHHGVAFGTQPDYIGAVPEMSPVSNTSSPSHQVPLSSHNSSMGLTGASAGSLGVTMPHYPTGNIKRDPIDGSTISAQQAVGGTVATSTSRSASNSSASSSITVPANANLSACSSPKSSQNPLINMNGSLQPMCRRQSSSVISTSSVGSNMSEYPGLSAESPTTIAQSSSVQVATVTSTPVNTSMGAITPDQSSGSMGSVDTAINETEQDSKESQLSQLHQHCAILLNEQQQQSRHGSINSPTSSANANNNNNNGTSISNNGNNNNATTSNVNSSNGGRTKRLRTSFKHNQLKEMKRWFAKNQNPDAKDLKQLAQTTQLTKRVLQVWFQNARAKHRRNNAKLAGQQLYEVNQQTSHLLQYQQQQVQQHQQSAYQHNPFH